MMEIIFINYRLHLEIIRRKNWRMQLKKNFTKQYRYKYTNEFSAGIIPKIIENSTPSDNHNL